jgi:hypothetical protein
MLSVSDHLTTPKYETSGVVAVIAIAAAMAAMVVRTESGIPGPRTRQA